MNRTFWAGVALQSVSLLAIVMTANPWTMVSGSVGLLLMTLGAYQGMGGGRNWADGAVVVTALAGVVGPLAQLMLATGAGAFSLTGLLVANLSMALICAGLLAHWLWSAAAGQRQRAAGVVAQPQQTAPSS